MIECKSGSFGCPHAFQCEKSFHTIPEQSSTSLFLVILSSGELPLYFRNQPFFFPLNLVRLNIFPKNESKLVYLIEWFCTSQQHRRNLFYILYDSLSNILRQLPCLSKSSPLQTKYPQFPQIQSL